MSQKKKSGLQRGLSDIVEKQTAPKQDASELSRGLIGKFTEPRSTLSTLGTQGTQGADSPPRALNNHPAPMRDFQKVANSITREAVPAGVFKGKCKQIYDFLYSKTRGAIVPTRSAKLTRQAIMEGSHVGSTKTLFLNLRHLRAAGLITWTESEGTHGGNEYTVYLPEETLSTQGTLSTLSDPGHFLPRVPMVETTQGTQGLSAELSTVACDPNTLIKDKERIDDEAAPLGELFRELEREVIGKNSASLQQWQDLRELLLTELKIATARTVVSNVPAFLTEHLRRRLWRMDKTRATEIAAAEQGNQSQTVSDEEKRKCPDCAGTGFWYPEGPDKGVARCTHLKLLPAHTPRETD